MPENTEETTTQVVDRRRFSSEGEAVTQDETLFSPAATDTKAQLCMDFMDALRMVIEGRRVTKLEWESEQTWMYLIMFGTLSNKMPAAKYVAVHRPDGSVEPLAVSDGDLLGKDWVVLE